MRLTFLQLYRAELLLRIMVSGTPDFFDSHISHVKDSLMENVQCSLCNMFDLEIDINNEIKD
jgi:hypothetical protein